jgi:hypothetical protein
MKKLNIHDVKQIVNKNGVQGGFVILFDFDNDKLAGVSYGKDTESSARVEVCMDEVIWFIENDEIKV